MGAATRPHPPEELRIAGLSRFSAVDWPGRLAATVFLQGCPWECHYCHNPALIDPREPGRIAWDEVAAFLRGRVGLLDGVVFSGGEPTMQRGLAGAIARVSGLGFAVGLHTGGAYPTLLAPLLPGLSWIGLDIKALPEDYEEVTGRGPSGAGALRSLDLVLAEQRRRATTAHPLDVEVRTTVHPDLIDEARLATLGDLLAERGVRRWALQRFRATGTRCGPARAEPPNLDAVPRDRFSEVVVR
ncbi:anaerobic ribonucleoside-triphosphate reductase activating protein [Microbacterium sp. NM3R9]|uniref:anaerobic ribonucleoside-triphosphate reductase activating protein n=1 Tax=Microbacterium thalli TaxID=3027921 RepID=UPI0023661701|nr:anaerobic ribonucleoside-triphosphate reductase activating protein [Microbacterium thalli]MDD7930626.1 anaerobic ribonucleoside-triphosphate reductase activating protein [Microbacterium thalli]MDN8550166.1 anaerobic ribonucleoside-triphosphate reductase activating protein [Microbacterium thalli]